MGDYDVLIMGGGPVGGALALALRDTGLKLGVLETRPPNATSDDPRPLALSHGTRLILERLGVWQALEPATPIARIHVSQRGGFGRVVLDADEARLPALGYVLDYARLATVTAEALRGGWCDYLTATALTGVRTEAETVVVELKSSSGPLHRSTRLLVIADGGMAATMSEMHTVDYRQTAVTARVTTAAAHDYVAYERFTPEGPLALLPHGEELALVWTTAPERAEQLCAAPVSAFLDELQEAFGWAARAFYRRGTTRVVSAQAQGCPASCGSASGSDRQRRADVASGCGARPEFGRARRVGARHGNETLAARRHRRRGAAAQLCGTTAPRSGRRDLVYPQPGTAIFRRCRAGAARARAGARGAWRDSACQGLRGAAHDFRRARLAPISTLGA